MRLIALLGFLFLTGCWISEPLYAPTESVRPMVPGVYRLSGPPDGVPASTVAILPNGLTRIGGDSSGEEPTFLGFISLDSEGRRFLAWQPENEAGEASLGFYLLVERSAEGEFSFYRPSCEGEGARIAVAAGATIEADAAPPTCRFPTRESLETAVRRLTADDDQLIGRLTKISDGR